MLVLALVGHLVPGQCFVSRTDVFLDSTNNSGILEVEDANVSSGEVTPAQVVGEDVSRRDEFYKEFVLENGLRLASI